METENIFKNNSENEKILYCYNNDTTSIDQVVAWFVLYMGYSVPYAVMLASIINNDKRAPIYKGTDKQLETLKRIFENKGLKTSIE